ncbi:GTA-gp10 family protein [Thioclava sp. GXIMD4215]|uniref:GTA-gp10 family protein n=1 Tax=Thioclava sp. GXIMD4215 TaxID=3131928 RepID=UPI00324F34B1
MANAFKGEVALSFEGQAYTMTFDFNAMCDFEDETGKNALEVLEGIENGNAAISAREMRLLFWAGLKQNHEDITKPLAGKILSANPDALMRASAAAAPQAGDGGMAGNAPRPGRQRGKKGRKG